MTSTWNIQRLLIWTEGYLKKHEIKTPRVDAEVLLSYILNKKRIDLYVEFDRPVAASELEQFKSLIKRRIQHEPVQYITGRQEFWSLAFDVNPSVLIPRPETECLIEIALEHFGDDRNQKLETLDIGCGSGTLAVVFAKEFPQSSVYAVDISEAALNVAKQNAQTHNVLDRITFLSSDVFSNVPKDMTFDLIVSNPPYIRTEDYDLLEQQVRDYEPKSALEAGAHGIDIHTKILEQAATFLKPEGKLIMEIAPGQAALLNDYLTKHKISSNMQVTEDYEHRERVVTFTYG